MKNTAQFLNRHLYSDNGVHKFEDFAEHVAQNDFQPLSLGWIAETEWFLGMRARHSDGVVYPRFYSENDDPNVKHRVRTISDVLNRCDIMHGKFMETTYADVYHGEARVGPRMSISEILDPKNGWLDEDGALHLEYGIQVEAILEDRIWKFNLHDPLFGDEWQRNMISFSNISSRFWCHREILLFHSRHFAKKVGDYVLVPTKFHNLEDLLQIALGVRESRDSLLDCGRVLTNVINTAAYLKMWNVTRLCEQQFIHLWNSEACSVDMIEGTVPMVHIAIEYNLSHLLAFLLDFDALFGESKVFKHWTWNHMDFKKAKGGTMKIIVKKLLYSDL